MAKERNFNPVQAQRKADKAKAIKKGKAENQTRRNEKLARRNPERVQRQINDLKAIQSSGGRLTSIEKQSLEALEKDLKAIKKAREALGDKAPDFGGLQSGHSLGKRPREAEDASSSDSEEVDEEVKRIPMPRDTPPPIPKEIMDAWWAKRRAKRANHGGQRNGDGRAETSANREPQGKNRLADRKVQEKKQRPPVVEPRTVYEAKPLIRDLQKEAIRAFAPTVVQKKLEKSKGCGVLIEPEEADQLEKEGYLRSTLRRPEGEERLRRV